MQKPTDRLARALRLFAMTAAASALLSGAATTASAQSMGSPGPAPDSKIYKDLSPALISLSRPADGKPGEFIIRLTSRYGQSGCQRVGKVGYGVEFLEQYVTINLQQYSIDMTNLPLHPEYQCGGNTVYPSAEIPLSLEMLKDKGTTQVRFQDGGELDYYDIIETDHSIELAPQPPAASTDPRFRPATDFGNVLNPMKVWLYPKNTVILRAAGAPKGMDLRERMDSLARAHSLVPLEKTIADFTSPIDDPYSFYYVDKTKKHELLKKDGIKNGMVFDTISVPSVVYGANGDETVDRPIQVFVHTPNVYE